MIGFEKNTLYCELFGKEKKISVGFVAGNNNFAHWHIGQNGDYLSTPNGSVPIIYLEKYDNLIVILNHQNFGIDIHYKKLSLRGGRIK